ncbi:hypothetical protein [Polluticaenibacter yanchengensis]|uniref:DUF4401 domain-containing protein n=1 Tax=Polluticaenibacter yanchengensis TaxID=3014562 RepID=A0ABT4UF21_9BACT|nr:hypothetical protein [Chitinophagaceae bacterium LY-5]
MTLFAYNKDYVEKFLIREKGEELFNAHIINKNTFQQIRQNTEQPLYTPGFFVRIGFLLLTVIISLLGFGLGLLTVIDSNETAIGVLALFYGLTGVFIAELFIAGKKHFRSGIDDAILLMCGIAFAAFAGFVFKDERAVIITVLIVSVAFTIRYTHQLSTISAVFALMFLIQDLLIDANPYLVIAAQVTAMSVIIVTSVLAVKKGQHIIYFQTLQLLKYTAIIVAYAFLNYPFINEKLFFRYDQEVVRMPSNLVWAGTFLFPLLIFAYAFIRKEIWLLRFGVILFILSLIGFYQYHPFIPTEWALSILGTAAIIKALFFIRYFNPVKFGFTSKPQTGTDNIIQDQVGAAIITENITVPKPGEDTTRFGGGNFGGGGAWQDY